MDEHKIEIKTTKTSNRVAAFATALFMTIYPALSHLPLDLPQIPPSPFHDLLRQPVIPLCNAAGYGCCGVAVTSDRDTVADNVLKGLSFEKARKGLRHAALTSAKVKSSL